MRLFNFLRRSCPDSVTVNFDEQTLYMPNGAVKVKDHHPARSGVQVIEFSKLTLERISPNQTGRQYLQNQRERPLCDALIIDALGNLARKEKSTTAIEKILGSNRLVLFFGTTFLDANGNECIPFLNLSSSLPAIRYLIGLDKPIYENTVPCYAAILE